MVAGYHAIEALFPEELQGKSLLHFMNWLTDRVFLVVIATSSDEQAYTVFETMNDRGLSLSPTDMLKGASAIWRNRIEDLRTIGKEHEAEFFKTWLRSQYAVTITTKKPGLTVHDDFDRIGSEFHRWVGDHASDRDGDLLALVSSGQVGRFVQQQMPFYVRHYLTLQRAMRQEQDGLAHILFNANTGSTLQPLLLMSPLQMHDPDSVVEQKFRLVAMYLDIVLCRRIWNYRSIAHNSLHQRVYALVKEIRGQDAATLADILVADLERDSIQFGMTPEFGLHMTNWPMVKHLLARMTDHANRASGMEGQFAQYVNTKNKKPYEMEHVLANNLKQSTDGFIDRQTYDAERNRIGGLLLLPKAVNASLGNLTYLQKRSHYLKQNLLAQSLHPDAYDRNPGFRRFLAESGLPFRPLDRFARDELQERQALYLRLAEHVWNPENLRREVVG